jgi:hypothetical protein
MTSTETTEHTTPRELWRALRRHPRDLPERLMVLAVTRQGPDAKAWARERGGAAGDALSDGGRVLAALLGLSLIIALSMLARR